MTRMLGDSGCSLGLPLAPCARAGEARSLRECSFPHEETGKSNHYLPHRVAGDADAIAVASKLWFKSH